MTDWRTTRAGKRWLALYGHRRKVRITWLARARLLSGQSVAQAAKACGLSPRTWEAWERYHNWKPPHYNGVKAITIQPWGRSLAVNDLLIHPYCTVNPSNLEVIP
jgi:hypothetical protein